MGYIQYNYFFISTRLMSHAICMYLHAMRLALEIGIKFTMLRTLMQDQASKMTP